MRRAASTPPELPGYTFVKLLGSGGFSDVFLYDQHLPKRRVAVKVLLTDDITDASRDALVAEANLMAQLSAHPYIVTIYQADVASDARPYFVMEYCSGPSLADRYKRETFAVADALRTGVRLSSAVATAHAAGILHRDIKPANVLSNDYGWPALTDFGISSALDDELPLHTTTLAAALNDTGTQGGTGQSVGMSVPWSPPEMFEDDPQPDVRSDVFSLAATIYTILAGQTPFEVRGRSNGTLDLIGRIERGAITPMSRDDVPRSLLAVLNKGMASDRADRFATAVDFARALQRVELELGYAPTAIDVPNLLVAAPVREAEGEDENETKVRSVATIDAQPAVRPPAHPPEQSSADETVVRGAKNIVAQPSAPGPDSSRELPSETVVRRREPILPPPESPEPVAAPAPVARPRSIAGWVIGGVAVLVAAGVTAAIVFGGVMTPGDAVPTPTGSAPPVVIESIPTPQIAGPPTADGSTVTFTFTNPDPQDGDTFLWQITNRTATEPVRQADGNAVVVDDYAPGSTVCVSVSIARAGKLSANPFETCYPA
ncbi:serine/threonine protein kinase [Salinibacterium sp. CAN_S4]|uniref:serine/threonine-protein kinase n=1 Tax=Salinibacterium sp. CAN_S4 TaxID=2787727 RepID=UPI0018EF9105